MHWIDTCGQAIVQLPRADPERTCQGLRQAFIGSLLDAQHAKKQFDFPNRTPVTLPLLRLPKSAKAVLLRLQLLQSPVDRLSHVR